jgi:glycosyltransferase involved in cell wall biosynthesis
MAVLEAAACGTPIVGTAVGALCDLAPEAAVATPVGDADGLAQALLDLLRDPDRAVQIGRAAQQAVARGYSLERSTDRFISIYESLNHD